MDNAREMQRKIRNGRRLTIGLYLLMMGFGLIALFFSSCKSVQYVPVDRLVTEYVTNDVLQRDSIYLQDSIYVRDKGDTVFVERLRYLYRDRYLRDSIYFYKTDSVQVPYPVEVVKEVKKPLTTWQTVQIWCGRALLMAVLALIVFFVIKLKLK